MPRPPIHDFICGKLQGKHALTNKHNRPVRGRPWGANG